MPTTLVLLNRVSETQPLRFRERLAALLVLFLVATTSGGCTLHLIGAYDDTIDKSVTEFQQKVEVYFAKLQTEPKTPYDQGVYDDLNVRLALLKSRAAALAKYTIIQEQVVNLTKQIDDFQKVDHITTRPVAAIITTSARSAIAGSVESILRLELALKRGDS
jgi:hypothetical protein